MARLQQGMRNLDIELTNRCNALCTFCPRDKTPEQGFMPFETFTKTIERALELDVTPKIHSAGQGEPTLHPRFADIVDHVSSKGLEYGFTTNGSLLTEELSRRVLDSSVEHICFSISDLGEDYEEVYALNFDNTRANILRFLDMNEAAGNPVRTQVSLVAHDLNRDKLADYQAFWREAGISEFCHFEQTNRGGACDIGLYFVDNQRHSEDARRILQQNGLTHVCVVPFVMLFVGWNGQYYLCCNDYRKLTPLGSVFDHSIEDMDVIKKAKFFEQDIPAACLNCDLDTTNIVREVLFEIEAGEAPPSRLQEKTAELIARQQQYPDFVLAEPVG
ncbi:MAG: hypothetical protein Hals2KO_05180 [Halioglobus sp.]